jgi:hypothetical protein
MDYACGEEHQRAGQVNLLGNSIVLIAPKKFKIGNVAIGKAIW